MKIVGIITEYNPFHNGHIFHIQRVREISKCDILVCVMSGNFVMRGNVSIIDKYTKTKIALKNQIDLVVELPTYYVNQSSDMFAYGAISTLNKLMVDEIYFGSECNNIEYLYKIFKKTESNEFKIQLNHFLKEGNSYASSYQKALGIDLKSNDLLGLEYIRSKEKLKSNIKLYTIKRESSNYNDSFISNSTIQSATYLRSIIDPKDYVPTEVREYMLNNSKRSISDFFAYFYYQMLILSKNELRNFLHITEGIENLLLKNLTNNYQEFINQVKNKRYSENRINRIIISILLNINKKDFENCNLDFVLVLGFNDKGKKLLNLVKKNINIYTKLKPNVNNLMNLQIKADKLYNYMYQNQIPNKNIIIEKNKKA